VCLQNFDKFLGSGFKGSGFKGFAAAGFSLLAFGPKPLSCIKQPVASDQQPDA
jgi:hypothetical protein